VRWTQPHWLELLLLHESRPLLDEQDERDAVEEPTPRCAVDTAVDVDVEAGTGTETAETTETASDASDAGGKVELYHSPRI